jgi:hypothetical protein
MRIAAALLVSACSSATAACNTLAAPGDAPAIVTSPTAAGRAELLRVVSTMLGRPVVLPADALAVTSELTIERDQALSRPERFRLVISHGRCVLVHEADGERWQLTETTCSPE